MTLSRRGRGRRGRSRAAAAGKQLANIVKPTQVCSREQRQDGRPPPSAAAVLVLVVVFAVASALTGPAQLVPPGASLVGVVIVVLGLGKVGRGMSPRSVREALWVGRARRGRVPHLRMVLKLDSTTRLLLLFGPQQRGKHRSRRADGERWGILASPPPSSYTSTGGITSHLSMGGAGKGVCDEAGHSSRWRTTLIEGSDRLLVKGRTLTGLQNSGRGKLSGSEADVPTLDAEWFECPVGEGCSLAAGYLKEHPLDAEFLAAGVNYTTR
jgi:hypothetical protein